MQRNIPTILVETGDAIMDWLNRLRKCSKSGEFPLKLVLGFTLFKLISDDVTCASALSGRVSVSSSNFAASLPKKTGKFLDLTPKDLFSSASMSLVNANRKNTSISTCFREKFFFDVIIAAIAFDWSVQWRFDVTNIMNKSSFIVSQTSFNAK